MKVPVQPKESLHTLIIRHGESEFNEATDVFKKNFQDDVHSELAKRQFQLNKQLIDSSLTALGNEQAYKIKQQEDLKKVEVVFVSPLKRTLETAQIIFGGRQVKIIVLPQLSEILSKVCDISQSIEFKKKMFPKMDFSYFKDKESTWQLQLLNETDYLRSKSIFRQQTSSNIISNYLFELIQNNFPNSTQPRQACSQRVKRAKNIICGICTQLNVQKIAIVVHRRVILEMTKTPDCPQGVVMSNCQFRKVLI